jgi:hypothetical protein
MSIVHDDPPQSKIASRRHHPAQPTRRKPTSPPQRYALDIGKSLSLELTLKQYGITPNATTLQRLGGAS